MNPGGSYPSATVGLTSAGNSGSAFNVVHSATASFATHPSYQPNGQKAILCFEATVAWIKYWQKCNTANVNKEWTHSL
jgi:hypothetical protein